MNPVQMLDGSRQRADEKGNPSITCSNGRQQMADKGHAVPHPPGIEMWLNERRGGVPHLLALKRR